MSDDHIHHWVIEEDRAAKRWLHGTCECGAARSWQRSNPQAVSNAIDQPGMRRSAWGQRSKTYKHVRPGGHINWAIDGHP